MLPHYIYKFCYNPAEIFVTDWSQYFSVILIMPDRYKAR